MKRTAIILAAIVAPWGIAACTQVGVNSASSQIVTAGNDVYYHFSQAGEDLVRAGLLDKATYKDADTRAYAVLVLFRAGKATLTDLTAAAAAITNGARK